MKITWKVLIAVIIIVGGLVWAVATVRSHSYSGTTLNFHVGGGPVTVTNPSDVAVPVQLVDTGSRMFSVSSRNQSIAGSSTQQASGSKTVQVFEFKLPPGTSVFTVTRGLDVAFISQADVTLQATVDPLNEGDARTTIVVAVVVMLGAFFYLARTGDWMNALRRKEDSSITASRSAERLAFNRRMGRMSSEKPSSGQ